MEDPTFFTRRSDGVEPRADLDAVAEAARAAHVAAAADGESRRAAGAEVRALRQKANQALWRRLGIEDEALAFVTARDSAVGVIDRPVTWELTRDPSFRPRPPQNVGRLRLQQIVVGVSPNPVGLWVEADDDASGCRFFGQITRDDGDLAKGSAGACDTWFRLTTAKMPRQGHYESRPSVELVGSVWGATGGGPWWASGGDNWCKCWLHLTQVLRADSAEGPIVATAADTRQLLFMEDDDSDAEAPLPGAFFFPSITFNLDPARDLIAELHLNFEYQFEGWSVFRFGAIGDLTQATYRVHDWTLLPA